MPETVVPDTGPADVPPVPSGGVRWALVDGWTLTRRAVAHWVRDPAPVVFSLVFGVLIVLMFGYLFGGAMRVPDGGEYREFLMPGMFTMTMLFGVGHTAQAVTADLDRGVIDRFRAMPMSSAAVLIGRAVADLLLSAVSLAVMVGVGLLVGWAATGSAGEFAAAIGLILLLRFALSWVGVYLGLVLTGPSAVFGAQTLEFPVAFLSSALVATGTMPAWLGVIADWNPLSSTATATRDLFGNPGVGGEAWVTQNAVLMAVVWPVALLLVFFPLSVHAFRGLRG